MLGNDPNYSVNRSAATIVSLLADSFRVLALDSAKTQFFTNISHELRTPLTLILAPLGEVLSDKPSTLVPDVREKLITVQKNSVRLLNMVK